VNHSNCGAVAVYPCEVLDMAILLTGRALEITGPSAASRFIRYQTLSVSTFWTLLPHFRNNEKPGALGFWLLGTTACRVNQLDSLQHLIPIGAGDCAPGRHRFSPIRWKGLRGTCISGVVRFHDVIGIISHLFQQLGLYSCLSPLPGSVQQRLLVVQQHCHAALVSHLGSSA
jgi:hypothetical protein